MYMSVRGIINIEIYIIEVYIYIKYIYNIYILRLPKERSS